MFVLFGSGKCDCTAFARAAPLFHNRPRTEPTLALKPSADILFGTFFCASVMDAANVSRASSAVMLVAGFGVETGAFVTAKVKSDGSAAAVDPEPFKIASAT